METNSNTATTLINDIKPKKHRWRKFKIWFFVLLLLSATFYFLFLRPFSTGYREGYVTKFSHKGLIFKTYEGELIKNLLSASMSNDVFKFSVSDKDIAKKMDSIDQRSYVKLKYNEYLFHIFFKGDTKYFIYEIKPMDAPIGVNVNTNVTPVK